MAYVLLWIPTFRQYKTCSRIPIKQQSLTFCYATRSFNLWNKTKHFTSEENKWKRQERNVRLRSKKERKESMEMKMDEFEKGNEYSRRIGAKNSFFFIFTFCWLIWKSNSFLPSCLRGSTACSFLFSYKNEGKWRGCNLPSVSLHLVCRAEAWCHILKQG
jgi:hypothetical protein